MIVDGEHHRRADHRGVDAAARCRRDGSTLAVAAVGDRCCSPAARRATASAPARCACHPSRGPSTISSAAPYDTAGLAVVARDATADPPAGPTTSATSTAFRPSPATVTDWLATRLGVCCATPTANRSSIPTGPTSTSSTRRPQPQRAQILDALGPVIDRLRGQGLRRRRDRQPRHVHPLHRVARTRAGRDLELARSYVGLAHGRGLAIGQKNAAECDRRRPHDVGFDFAVTEECAAFDECDAYRDVYGAARARRSSTPTTCPCRSATCAVHPTGRR